VYTFDRLFVDSRDKVFQEAVLPFIRSFFVTKSNIEIYREDFGGKDEFGLVLACGASGSGKVYIS
jgi:hypothetical protein